MSVASLAAGLALVGCSAAPPPAPTAPTPAAREQDEPPAPAAKAPQLTVAGSGSEREEAARKADEPQDKQIAGSAESAPKAPPPPEGAPPSWLAKAPPPYHAGDAARYLPKDCKDRVFVDAGGIVGSSAADVRTLIDKALKIKGDSKEEARIKKGIAVVQDAGADPVTTWREIAVCGNGREVVAIGVAGDKSIEVPLLIQKMNVAIGEDPGLVVRKGDVSTLVASDGQVFVQPAPGVFLISRDKDALLDGIGKKAGGAGFAAARGHLIHANMEEIEAAVTQAGDKLDITFTVHLRGSAAAGAKKDPKAVTAKLGEKLRGVADRMKGTPLEPVGERLRAVKVAVRGQDAVFNGTIQRSSLVSLLKGLNPSELNALMGSIH